MLSPHPTQQGFSLVELAIGMLIFSILLALAAPSFNNWMQSSQIRTAAEAIQNGLQLARAEAVRYNNQVQFALGTGSSWIVGCVTPTATCPATIQSRNAAEGSRNVTVAANQTTVAFNGLGRVTPVPAGDININITNPVGGTCAPGGSMRCLRVVTTVGGQIRMCDPALTFSTTFPQGC